MTSGRQNAMPSAIARDPSICFNMTELSSCRRCAGDGVMGGGRCGDVGFAELAGKRLPDGGGDRMKMDDAGQRGESTEQRRVGHRATDVLQGELGRGRHAGMAFREFCRHIDKIQLVKAFVGIDEEIAVRPEPLEHVDCFEQRWILDDQAVRLEDRLTQPDLLVVNAAEGHDRGTGALGAEAWKRLRMLAFEKGCDRKQFGRRHHSLAAPAMYAHLEHAMSLFTRAHFSGCASRLLCSNAICSIEFFAAKSAGWD